MRCLFVLIALLIAGMAFVDLGPGAAAERVQPAAFDVVPGRFIVVLAAGFTQSADRYAASLDREPGSTSI